MEMGGLVEAPDERRRMRRVVRRIDEIVVVNVVRRQRQQQQQSSSSRGAKPCIYITSRGGLAQKGTDRQTERESIA